MKKKINNTKLSRNAKIYVVHGNYDDYGQYHESYHKKVALSKLPDYAYDDVSENLNNGCDVTALIFPLFKSIFVFLPKDRVNKFVRHIDDNVVKELLDSELAQNFSKTTRVWMGYNFTE